MIILSSQLRLGVQTAFPLKLSKQNCEYKMSKNKELSDLRGMKWQEAGEIT
jgi:hypothetical protein